MYERLEFFDEEITEFFNRLVAEKSVHYHNALISDTVDIIGKVKYEGKEYYILGKSVFLEVMVQAIFLVLAMMALLILILHFQVVVTKRLPNTLENTLVR